MRRSAGLTVLLSAALMLLLRRARPVTEKTGAVRTYTWDITPEDLAGLFMAKGFKYARGSGPDGTVLPEDVIRMVSVSAEALVRSGKGYAELGRFVVFKDEEFPGGYEISMKIGYVAFEDEDEVCDPNCDCDEDDE